MFVKSLALVFLASLAVAEIPSYIKICGRKNPNLDKCVLESVMLLRDKLRDGDPELDLEPLEPLIIDTLPLINTNTLKTAASNVKVRGLSDFKITKLHIDLDNKRFNSVTVFDKLIIEADYEVNAKLVVPIMRKGPVRIVADGVESTAQMKWKIVKKNGVDHMYFLSHTAKIAIKDFKIDFLANEGSESPLTEAINSAIIGGQQELLEAVRPSIEKIVSEEVLKRANKMVKNFTYDELFPDRE